MFTFVTIILKAALGEVQNALTSLRDDAKELKAFHELIRQPSPSPDEYIELKKVLTRKGFKFGISYEEREVGLQAHQCMMRDDPTQLCNLLMSGSATMIKLREQGLSEETVAQVAAGVLQEQAMGLLGQLTHHDVPTDKDNCPTKRSLWGLCDAVTVASASEDFLVPSEVIDDNTLLLVVLPKQVDIKVLDGLLSKLEDPSSTDLPLA